MSDMSKSNFYQPVIMSNIEIFKLQGLLVEIKVCLGVIAGSSGADLQCSELVKVKNIVTTQRK